MAVSDQELIDIYAEAEARGDTELMTAIQGRLAARERFTPEPWTPNPEYSAGVNPIAGNLEQVLQGATFGMSDEAQALIGAATTAGQADGMGFLDRYRTIRDQMRGEKEQFTDQEGLAAYVPEMIGGAVTGLGGLAKGAGMAGLKGAALVGAAEGGLAGAGYAPGDVLTDPTPTALGATAGAAGGAIVGPGMVAGGRLLKKGGEAIINTTKAKFPNLTGVPERAAQQVAESGGLDDEMARYIIRGGKAVDDPLYPEAAKQGISDGMINAIKEMSPADRQKGAAMLRIIKRGKENANFADRYRPGDIVGDTLIARVEKVTDVNKKARMQLDRFAETRLKDQPVDIAEALQRFATEMDDNLRVRLVQNTKGGYTPNFDDSYLAPKDRGPIREVIKHVTAMLNQGKPTGYEAHRLKRAIDNNIPWDATNKMTADGERLLKGLRHDINEALRDTFDGYREINEVVQETLVALQDFGEVVGRRYDPDMPNAAQYVGQEARKLATNYNSRVPMMNAIEQLENVAKKHGLDTGEDVFRQATLVNRMEELFGPSAKGGFEALTQRGMQRSLERIGGPLHAAHELTEPAVNIARGISDEARFDILQKLLSR